MVSAFEDIAADPRFKFFVDMLNEARANGKSSEQLRAIVCDVIVNLEESLKRLNGHREQLYKLLERNTDKCLLHLPEEISNCPVEKYDRELSVVMDAHGLAQLYIDTKSQLYRDSVGGAGLIAHHTVDRTFTSQTQLNNTVNELLATPLAKLTLNKAPRELKKGDHIAKLLISDKGTPLVVRDPEYKQILDDMVQKLTM